MPLKLHTIVCSTRPSRLGPKIAEWFDAIAQGHDGFDAELVDLARFELPVFDEPKHPRLRDYAHDHTKAWSASVDAADAFVFVTPEYNYGPPPSFVNAVNYLFHEWNYKQILVVYQEVRTLILKLKGRGIVLRNVVFFDNKQKICK